MKYYHLTLVSALSLIFSSAPVASQNIYKWTDAQGRVHFSNTPVGAADSVDEDLPPSTSFGTDPDLSDSPPQPSAPAEQQATPPTPTTTAAAPPLEDDVEEDAEPLAAEDSTTARDDSPIAPEETLEESLPQTVAELSEKADEYETATSPPRKGDGEDEEDSSDDDADEEESDSEDEEDGSEESEEEE